jgi:hypothetical protein
MAHGIIVNAVRRPTANSPHTEKADFPVVIGPNFLLYNAIYFPMVQILAFVADDANL